MKITIESTTRIVTVNGVPARIWEGTTDSGIAVSCCITRIAAPAAADLQQFDRELQECRPPTVMGAIFPSRMFIGGTNGNGRH